jgi:threonylcarbamoyladenosine tRNA methylthiotransferase MtaB
MAETSVAIHTLGCKLNFAESATLTRMLAKEGFIPRKFQEGADIYVINTCSVTSNADKECRALIRRIKRKSPESKVVITGCYAQLKAAEISAMDGVDLVLGAGEKFQIASHLKAIDEKKSQKICSCDISELTSFHAAWSHQERTRGFLKVQDGCDYNCSFCTIPLARGKSRSDGISGVVSQAQSLAAAGIQEIVLTGVNLGDFGKSGKTPAEDFCQLIRALEEVEGISRFRISSIEPNLLTQEIIEWVAASVKFMPHFHMPLQSGNNRILGLMKRRYRRELYAQRVEAIRRLIPHCCIGADVITGFPSESDEDFSETLTFLQDLNISYLHVFTYSERSDTAALKITPIVPVAKRNLRTHILRSLSEDKMDRFMLIHKGQARPVLFESENGDGTMDGYTDNYIGVKAPFREDWVNRVVSWIL